MIKQMNNELVFFILNHHLNHFITVKKLVKHDYESHMILVTTYAHYIYQSIKSGKSLNWNELFASTELKDHKELMKKRKLTIFSVSENLLIPQETVRRKLKRLCERKLLDYSIKDGLSLGVNFKAVIEPLGKIDVNEASKLVKKLQDKI